MSTNASHSIIHHVVSFCLLAAISTAILADTQDDTQVKALAKATGQKKAPGSNLTKAEEGAPNRTVAELLEMSEKGENKETLRNMLLDKAHGKPDAGDELELGELGETLATRLTARIVERFEALEESGHDIFRISLQDVIEMTLENNLDIAIARISPIISDEDIIVQKAAFDPTISASGSVRDNERPSASTLDFVPGQASTQFFIGESLSDTWSGSVTLTQPLIIGGNLSLAWSTNRGNRPTAGFISFNPQFSNDITASLRLPLLRGAGLSYNLSLIKIARNNKEKSLYQFKDQVMSIVSQAENAYWELVRALMNLAVNENSLETSKRLLESVKIRVSVGELAPIEIDSAEAEYEQRKEDVLIAQNNVKNREDELKRIMNLPQESLLSDIPIQPMDLPRFTYEKANLIDAVEEAFINRPDFAQAKIDLKNQKITVKRDKNALRPQLDMRGDFTYSGLGQNFGDSNDVMWSERFQSQSLRFDLSYPFGNRSAKGQYHNAKLNLRRNQLSLKNIENQILIQVNQAVRQIDTNRQRIITTTKSALSFEKRLKAEERKLDVGKSTTLLVLQAEEDFLDARNRLVAAIIDYNISLKDLELRKGTLLRARQIELEENPEMELY